MNDVSIRWTGESMPNAGLLYQSYTDLGYVLGENGEQLGTAHVLALSCGCYQARISGMTDDVEHATPVSAARAAADMHRTFRS